MLSVDLLIRWLGLHHPAYYPLNINRIRKRNSTKCIIQCMLTNLFYTKYSTIVFVFFLLVGCTPTDNIDSPTPSPSQTSTLQPDTATPILEPSPTPALTTTPVILVSPTPTATPILYQVISGDTLIEIANQYGLDTEELILANPSINPNLLTVGVTLTIPLTVENSIQTPIGTVDIELANLDCYNQDIGSTWCLASLANNQSTSYVNVSGSLSTLDQQGNLIESVPASTPIFYFPPNSVMPFGFYFPNGKADETQYSLVINTGTELSPDIDDVLWTELMIDNPTTTQNDTAFRLDFSIPEIPLTAETIHVLGYLLDTNGKIIGYRNIEIPAPSDTSTITDSLFIYSLGPMSEEYRIFAFAKMKTD